MPPRLSSCLSSPRARPSSTRTTLAGCSNPSRYAHYAAFKDSSQMHRKSRLYRDLNHLRKLCCQNFRDSKITDFSVLSGRASLRSSSCIMTLSTFPR